MIDLVWIRYIIISGCIGRLLTRFVSCNAHATFDPCQLLPSLKAKCSGFDIVSFHHSLQRKRVVTILILQTILCRPRYWAPPVHVAGNIARKPLPNPFHSFRNLQRSQSLETQDSRARRHIKKPVALELPPAHPTIHLKTPVTNSQLMSPILQYFNSRNPHRRYTPPNDTTTPMLRTILLPARS